MRLLKASATVGGLTLLSRLSGFARDIVTAAILGAGPIADAFFVALKLPNFFRKLTAEGAFSVSFVPLFAGKLEREGEVAAMNFAAKVQAMMLAIMVPFTILMIAGMPWVLYVLAPGFQSEPAKYALAVELTRITFPYILFMSLVAFLGGILNSHGKFGPFAFAPVLFNLLIIAALYFGSPLTETPAHAMAIGVAFAGVAQLVWMLFCMWRMKLRVHFRKPEVDPDVKRLGKLMVPGLIGGGVIQITAFIDTILATLLPSGAVSYLYYADRLYQMPLSIIGIALGTALLPMLAGHFRSGRVDQARHVLGQGVEIGLILSLPCAAALMVAAYPIMDILFVRGAFDAGAARASASAIVAYALGIPAFVLVKVFSAAYFAKEDTVTPVKFAIVNAVLNVALSLSLMPYLAHVGIALAATITAIINMALLLQGLVRRGIIVPSRRAIVRVTLISLAALIMAGVLWAADRYLFDVYLHDANDVTRFAALAAMLGTGGIGYLAAIHGLGIYRIGELISLVRRRKSVNPENTASSENG